MESTALWVGTQEDGRTVTLPEANLWVEVRQVLPYSVIEAGAFDFHGWTFRRKIDGENEG